MKDARIGLDSNRNGTPARSSTTIKEGAWPRKPENLLPKLDELLNMAEDWDLEDTEIVYMIFIQVLQRATEAIEKICNDAVLTGRYIHRKVWAKIDAEAEATAQETTGGV